MNRYEIHLGDCTEVLKALPDNSVDSIVTDPPYGIRFMGKSWDGADIEARVAYRSKMESHDPGCGPNGAHRSRAAEAGKYDLTPSGMLAFQQFTLEWATEALRVLKPGGHLLCFAAARTYHHMAVGVEMAGFEIRDQLMWVFGSGFPKSHNLKGEWEGWGTALKPGHEPICMARKPFKGTVAANVLAYGTGALNIDGCLVPFAGQADENESKGKNRHADFGTDSPVTQHAYGEYNRLQENYNPPGRWPANLIHDGSDDVIDLFPVQKSGSRAAGVRKGMGFHGATGDGGSEVVGSSGSAARFFYCAKASRKDRNEGLSDPGPQFQHGNTLRKVENTETKGNNHPTVKPTDLMAYLCRLVTPPGGVVLDPFMGSGSTGKAAMREGFRFIGIELDEGYLAIAQARIAHEAGKDDGKVRPA